MLVFDFEKPLPVFTLEDLLEKEQDSRGEEKIVLKIEKNERQIPMFPLLITGFFRIMVPS